MAMPFFREGMTHDTSQEGIEGGDRFLEIHRFLFADDPAACEAGGAVLE
jgi:hypothetical protein